MPTQDVFQYIKSEETSFSTARVPLTSAKDWNMKEHIERCYAVANGYYFTGVNDGLRPYDDIVTPIINVAFRTEGFDVKDIIPYVNEITQNYKSFLIKKRHPQWARVNQLDTFIDDVVESSVIYDLVLVKNVNNVHPEVINLQSIAFCDQTDIMAGPICIKHQMTPQELVSYKGKWDSDKIDMAIKLAMTEKKVSMANDQVAKTPGKYVEVYELRGNLPDTWNGGTDEYKYTPQMKIVSFYDDPSGEKQGLILFEGVDKPLEDNFSSLKVDRIRSKGRACGKSIVETLFEPQVWRNYDAIKIKALLDSAINIIITDSDELGNKKISDLKANTILKQNRGDNTQFLNAPLQNLSAFTNDQIKQENSARALGSASDLALGNTPASGTPLGTTEIVHVEGQGIHVYRQGKIATWFADTLYPKFIIPYMIKDMKGGLKFSEELSLDEMVEIAKVISENQASTKIKELILSGEMIGAGQRESLVELYTENFKKGGSRKFFEVMKGEMDSLPISVFINIKSKQKNMAQDADKITNIIREIMKNPQAFSQNPGISRLFNELLENSGFSPLDYTSLTTPQQPEALPQPPGAVQQPLPVT